MGLSRYKRVLHAVVVVVLAVFVCCEPAGLSAGLPRVGPEREAAPGDKVQREPLHQTLPAGDSVGTVEKTSPISTEETETNNDSPAASLGQGEPRQSKREISRGSKPAAGQKEQKSPLQPQRAEKNSSGKQSPPEPVSYVWGRTHQVTFRSRVKVTNTGTEKAENVWVDLPMLENSSPYQKTTLQSTNYEPAYLNGRVGSFGVGDIDPGESVVIKTDYQITMKPLSIRSTDKTVEKARRAFQQYAGSGSCSELAKGFVRRCRELGVKARLVNGYARAGGGDIASGSLKGCRHSWAEFYIEGLGWVPVDLTFKYFAFFPHASHLVETYADQAVKVYHLGGKISVIWENEIL